MCSDAQSDKDVRPATAREAQERIKEIERLDMEIHSSNDLHAYGLESLPLLMNSITFAA